MGILSLLSSLNKTLSLDNENVTKIICRSHRYAMIDYRIYAHIVLFWIDKIYQSISYLVYPLFREILRQKYGVLHADGFGLQVFGDFS